MQLRFPGLPATGGGVWRSTDDGVTFTQIKTALDPANINDRSEFAVTPITGGFTRMYVGDGNTGSPTAHVYRSDDVATGVPVFTDLTAAESPAGQTDNYCSGQCWYDNFVVTPAGNPDMVYVGGSFDYGTYGCSTNGRGVLRSTDAGASFTDMTWDSTTASTRREAVANLIQLRRMECILTSMDLSLAEVTRPLLRRLRRRSGALGRSFCEHLFAVRERAWA